MRGSRFFELSIDRPRSVLLAAFLLTLLALPGLFRLELRTDGHALVPPDSPTVRWDQTVRQRFGLRDPIVVLIDTHRPGGIYDLKILRMVTDLSREIAAIPEIGPRYVQSLATEHRDRVYPGTLDFRPFLDPLPTTPELMETLRSDVDAPQILDGTLVSKDRRAVSIFVGVLPIDPKKPYDRAELYRKVEAKTRPFRGPGHTIEVVGAPVAESLLGDHILEDLKLLLPLSLAIIALVLWWGTRRLWAVAISFLKILMCLTWTFGLMGWVGSPIYLTTAVLPVILVTVGLAYEIHFLWHYQGVLARSDGAAPHPADLRHAVLEIGRPILLSAITTALGFFSFLTSSLPPVRSFGLYAGLGVVFSMLWTVIVAPACLALLPRAALLPPAARGRGERGGFLRAAFAPLLRRPVWTLAALGLLTALAGLGATRLFIQDSWIDGFSKDSPFRRSTDRVGSLLLGTHVLLVHFSFHPPEAEIPEVWEHRGPLLEPRLMEAIGRFEESARAQPGVGGVLGPYSEIKAVNYLWLARQEGSRSIPKTPERLDRAIEMFDTGRGIERRREVIADDRTQTVITVFLKGANYRDTARIMAALRRDAAAILGPYHMRMSFAGDVAVSQAMIPAIVKTQVSSVLGSLASCLVVLILLHRSWKLGALALLPTTLSVAWVFGLMGWLGIPLGVATSMFCAITIGIGDDYAIHLIDRFREAVGAGRTDPVLAAVGEAGPAIAYDTLAIALGFGVLAVSQVPANARLGILVALALVSGFFLTLAGLGSALQIAADRQPKRAARGGA
jgi:predicted RND superfamily exporter protein